MDEPNEEPTSGDFEVNTLWVNVYLVSQHYGGPEEGGWWYDAGELVASVPYAITPGNTATIHWYENEDTGERRRYLRDEFLTTVDADELDRLGEQILAQVRKVYTDERVRVYYEDSIGTAWPAVKPHYC